MHRRLSESSVNGGGARDADSYSGPPNTFPSHWRQEPFLVARKTYTKPSKYAIKLVGAANPTTNSKFAEQYATNNKANQIFLI
jgi:hypothetical protein